MQWAGGNDLTWDQTNKSNYPNGETIEKPQFITSSILIGIYKVFATLSTPICGINLLVLLGYMSTALLMFGLVRWLLKRIDIALFAGFAAAFVPFHLLKSQSHINYIYGSIFIALMWAYLWYMSKPSYKRAALLGLVSSLGFYFDGYFILFSALVIGALYSSSFIVDFLNIAYKKEDRSRIFKDGLTRLKHLSFAVIVLVLLLVPILAVYRSSSDAIEQSLANSRSNIFTETQTYGARPIEFILPSYQSAFTPDSYQNWRATKLHGSNYSESTLYIGFTLILLAITSIASLIYRKYRREKLRGMPYIYLVFTFAFVFLGCFFMSLPATVYLFGHDIKTPVYLLATLTENWRVLSRLFLAMHPAVVILASLGLYILTKNQKRTVQLGIVAVCSALLFLEYLPSPINSSSNLNINAPAIYKQLRADPSVKLVAEYPLADFTYTPEIFTFQPIHNKVLLNANDSSISKGPFRASIAGLNDIQTPGALQALNIDLVITRGFSSSNPGLTSKYNLQPVRNKEGEINLPASIFAYKINDSVLPRKSLLMITKGYESLSVDTEQISHRYITSEGTFKVFNMPSTRHPKEYSVSFDIGSACPTDARIYVSQSDNLLWSGNVAESPTRISLAVGNKPFTVKTTRCSVDITNMSANPLK